MPSRDNAAAPPVQAVVTPVLPAFGAASADAAAVTTAVVGSAGVGPSTAPPMPAASPSSTLQALTAAAVPAPAEPESPEFEHLPVPVVPAASAVQAGQVQAPQPMAVVPASPHPAVPTPIPPVPASAVDNNGLADSRAAQYSARCHLGSTATKRCTVYMRSARTRRLRPFDNLGDPELPRAGALLGQAPWLHYRSYSDAAVINRYVTDGHLPGRLPVEAPRSRLWRQVLAADDQELWRSHRQTLVMGRRIHARLVYRHLRRYRS